MAEEVKKGLFDASWDMTADELDAEERELKKSELQREFERQYDKSTEEIVKLKRAQQTMTKDKMKNFDLNAFRKNRFEISQFIEAQTEIKKLYFEVFQEEMKR